MSAFDTNKMQYAFKTIGFCKVDGINVVRVNGTAMINWSVFDFTLTLSPTDKGEWILRNYNTERKHIEVSDSAYIQGLVNAAERLLRVTNAWTHEQLNRGASVAFNEKMVPDNARNRLFLSMRNQAQLASGEAGDLWENIKDRIVYDEFFFVQGFTQDEVMRAITQLESIFPNEWVAARYREALGKSDPSFCADYPHDASSWYPASHLARTAKGVICVDPAWNYLIELGLALEELTGLEGCEKLKQQVARSPGTQHHICFAAELKTRGYLVGLEPSAGSGSITNDLHVYVDGYEYDIEVKEFSSANPAKQLRKELLKKSERIPENPERPVIFYAVLVGNGKLDPDKEKHFFEEVNNLSGKLPGNVGAVVAGRRFVDSSGGGVKRDAQVVLVNQNHEHLLSKSVLENIFAKNYDELTYPLFGIGSFVDSRLKDNKDHL